MSEVDAGLADPTVEAIPQRTLVREVLITQLVFAAVVGAIAIVCVWWVANWVVRDNLGDWSTRWIGEIEALGEGLYLDDDNERFLALNNYIARSPEISYVRYYNPDGEIIYVESKGGQPLGFASLDADALRQLEQIALDAVAYQVDESLDPVVRISQAVVTESIVSSDLFAAESLEELETKAAVVGFVELGVDYGRYDQALFGSVFTGSLFIALGVLTLALVGRIVLRRAMQPLADVEAPLLRLARGDLDIDVPSSPHREIAAISRALGAAVTKIRKRDQHMRRLAHFDELTGLASRHHFMESLTERIDMLSAGAGAGGGALLFIDLDQFKHVNDTVGHHAGDAVLAQTASRIRQAVREDDLVGRLGGDEFVIFAARITTARAEDVANKIIRELREYPLSFEGQSFNVACSVGIAMVPDPNIYTPAELLSQADLACRQAKANGRNRAQTFRAEARELDSIRNDVAWQHKIQDALKHDRFVLHYQPIMHIATEKIDHYEALLRLQDDDELHLPGAFLSAAMRFGLMQDIDRWVIKHALTELAERRITRPELTFCVNIAGSAFADGTLASFVAEQLSRRKLPASALVLEITEKVAIDSFAEAADQISELVELGCAFAVDDFGTGYSSLSYLKRLPADYIKIDGAFIRKLTESDVDESIVRAIADIARITGKRTVAEFVGDEATLELIREIGIDFAQGFHIGKPGPTLAVAREHVAGTAVANVVTFSGGAAAAKRPGAA